MNRIALTFNELKAKNEKALITFVTAGDPEPSATIRLVCEMEKRGADIIELGVPYSDPMAEGPVIQEANERALKNGIRMADVMDMVSELRKTVRVPLVYLLYFNCILQYGPDRFFAECARAGIDGVIVPDLPFEEKGEIDGISEAHGVDLISMVSPTSRDRIDKIASSAKGFLYCVSSLGVTGVRGRFDTDFESFFSAVDRTCRIPKAIGFGISTPEQVAALKKYCDGVIVGSAIVRKAASASDVGEAVKNVGDFTEELKKALLP